MIAAFVKQVMLISAFSALAQAVLPDSGSGRFAACVIRLTGLALIIAPIAELLYGS